MVGEKRASDSRVTDKHIPYRSTADTYLIPYIKIKASFPQAVLAAQPCSTAEDCSASIAVIFTFVAITTLLPAYVFSFDSTLDEMDVQMMALTLALLHKRKHHQYWVLPLLCTGLEMGQFYTPFYKIRKDESEFF